VHVVAGRESRRHLRIQRTSGHVREQRGRDERVAEVSHTK